MEFIILRMLVITKTHNLSKANPIYVHIDRSISWI